MAAMKLAWVIVLLACCGKLQGISGEAPPLATMQVEITGDPGAPGENLYVALVWGMEWLPEALCLDTLEPGSDGGSAQAILTEQLGCRDPFGFVPLRVETSVPVVPNVPATLALEDLPASDVLVGDVDARVTYASFVVYDDRNGTGNLELARPNRISVGSNDMGSGSDSGTNIVDLPDVVYGASFMTMTAPDQRLAYREGAFVETAFYPRAGCADPPPAFSIVGASGFTVQAAIDSVLAGTLPPETDPSQCTEAAAATTVVPIAVTAANVDEEAACTENTADSSVRYREPMATGPDLTDRVIACVPLPSLGGSAVSPQIQLIVTGRSDDSCKGLTHYVLTGCRTDASCEMPDWDHSEMPPSWWPC
jgi:hypothetical protein